MPSGSVSPILLAVVAGLLSACTLGAAVPTEQPSPGGGGTGAAPRNGAESESRAQGPGLQVNEAAGEVRIPCWFVNPTYKLEVFACHESGPTHETVVAFGAEGEDIYAALLRAGFRGPEYWNATSSRDLLLTGGDRALAWLRWEWKGKVEEVPAEEILIEEATALPLFVRGFSFTAQRVLLGDPPRRAIPTAVELTIGGTNRQSATFSMLCHINDLPEMVNWCPAPEIDPARFPDFKDMVDAKAPCTLIVRRVRSEADLVDIAARREASPERKAVREAERPVAERIDAKKAEFEKLIGEVRAVLEEGQRLKVLTDKDRESYRAKITALIDRGALLDAEIRELYFGLLSVEEKHRLGRLRDAPGLNADQRAWAVMAYLSGFRFEQAIAAKEREAASLAVVRPEPAAGPDPSPGSGKLPAERAALLRKAIEKEIEALQIERDRRWIGFKLDHEFRAKLRSLDPGTDKYLVRLFQESELRALADMRSLRAKAEAARADAEEGRAGAAGASSPGQEPFRRCRAAAEAAGKLAAAEIENVELLEKIRWAENPSPGDDREDVPGLQKRQADVLRKVGELRAALEKLTARPAGTGEEPPIDGDGKRLFPDDVAG